MKCFLSHSSHDKNWFVNQVYERLPRDQAIIDENNFAHGAYTKDEITRYASISEVFVYFISEQSLEAGWVQDEVRFAEDLCREGKIKLFIPVIIDKNIHYSDTRLSHWLQANFNLKYMGSPKQVAKRIKDELFYMSLKLLPTLEEEYTLCLGRFNETTQFIRRYEDFQKEKLKLVIASGIPLIGRRTFLRNLLLASQVKSSNFRPYEITMDERGSIEDFIAKLEPVSDAVAPDDLKDMLSKDMNAKKNLLLKILKEIAARDEILLINDTNCLIDYTNNIPSWFSEVLENVEFPQKLVLLISSNRYLSRPKDYILCINLTELAQQDACSIFSRLLSIRKKSLSEDAMMFWTRLLVGHPGQIKFTINFLEKLNYNHELAKNNSYEVRDYLDNQANILLHDYVEDENTSNILRFFAIAEFASIELFHSIFSSQESEEILQKLINACILEFVGDNRDFIRLNGVFQDYVLRNTNKFSKETTESIKALTVKCVESGDLGGDDLSKSLFVATSALESEDNIDLSQLFPVHIIRAMVNIYNRGDDFSRVIHLADELLAHEHNIADNIVEDALYYKCMSLARLQNRNVLSLIQKLPEDKETFVRGFYFRRVGRPLDAIEQFEKIQSKKFIGNRAKREIVLALQQLERYDEAINLARENYVLNPNNCYHVQALFKCLIYSSSAENCSAEMRKELEKLIRELAVFKSAQATEMSMLASAQFQAFIEKNFTRAYDLTMDAISLFPDSKYPVLVLMDISLKDGNFSRAQEGYSLIDSYLSMHKRVPNRIFARQRAYFLSGTGHKTQALQILQDEINRLDDAGKEKLLNKIDYHDRYRLK